MNLDYIIFKQYQGYSRQLHESIKSAWKSLVQRLDDLDGNIMEAVRSHTRACSVLIDEPVPIEPVILIGPCRQSGCWGFVHKGLPFIFIDQSIAEFPASYIEATLAHELAHYYHFAINSVATLKNDEELQVDRRISGWGYNVLRLWIVGLLFTKYERVPTEEEIEMFISEEEAKRRNSITQTAHLPPA
jgi:hypothetical protein